MHEIVLIVISLTLMGLAYLFVYLVDINQPARAFTIGGVFIFFSRIGLLFWAINEDSGLLAKDENIWIADLLRNNVAFVLSILPMLIGLYWQLLDHSPVFRWVRLQRLKWKRKKAKKPIRDI